MNLLEDHPIELINFALELHSKSHRKDDIYSSVYYRINFDDLTQ